jgi:hypothetical protein
MITRFGSVELTCVANYLNLCDNHTIKKYLAYIKGRHVEFGWADGTKKSMENNAGFFPVTEENLIKFSELMLSCISNVDILGSWRPEEILVANKLAKAKTIPLADIEPYYHVNPWSRILENKNILVIHPFSKSIERQYLQREKLFNTNNILPQFHLETITAVQSIANNKVAYDNWFLALDAMKNQIVSKKYDIAIIGCGAYGFPLASFVKDQGKQAVHMGGATQILFGIKGNRWDDHEIISRLYNEYWIRPMKEETPDNTNKVENACYW